NLDHQAIPAIERLRRYTREVLERSEDPARVQLRADLWTAVVTEKLLAERLAATVQQRRGLLRGWIERAVRTGEMQDIPANAFASILLALTDGLMLHGNLHPSAFRWTNIRRALDVLLAGIAIESPGAGG
ncbi:MAG: TetR family transcriptional regulator C-terminal domain-containing protein, partial [Candidatus Dormibacteraceae bacterium]